MRKYMFIGIGGILGAVLRYLVKGIQIYHYHENVPLNTLIINITGSFVLALILTVSFEVWEIDADLRFGIATGFLGAYTTFSALCKETVGLLYEGDYFSAISYIAVSTMVGIAATYFAIILAREVISKLVKKDEEESEENMAEEDEGEME